MSEDKDGTRRPAPTDAPTGPYALTNPVALAGKAALACLIALLFDRLVGNPDVVSSTFVAVLCTSPTVVSGIRQSTAQVLGSLLGGIWGTLAVVAGLPREVGIPAAVGLAIGSCFAVRYPVGYPVAAFTALFVQAVPRGGPLGTWGIRMESVLIAALAALLTNLVVTAWSYRDVFRRRLAKVEAQADKFLVLAAARGPRTVLPCFAVLSSMEADLALALDELAWRRAEETRAWLGQVQRRVEAIHHLMHLVYDLGLLLDEYGIPHAEVAPFLHWARCGEGPPPDVPARLRPSAARIEALWAELRKRVE